MELESKVAVVTGSSANIGRAIALEFARQGARVVVHARANRSGGEAVADEIRNAGGEAIFVQADLSDPSQVETLFSATHEAYGGVDILVNNAGSATAAPFLESDKQHWLGAFDANFFSAVLCAIQASRSMLARGAGKIINTASIRGLPHVGRPGIMAYSAAKAALINFTKTLAKELAPTIQVNAVAPGFVTTPNYDGVPQALKDEFIGGTLINRWIEPAEMAAPYLFLAASDATTGEVLVVDGGYSLK